MAEIKFIPPVSLGEVRSLMRSHDLYVLSSDGYEGWGAVVSEALEEGMTVLATEECGAGPTLLPKEYLFRAGDTETLRRKIEAVRTGKLPRLSGIGAWNAANAAEALFAAAGKPSDFVFYMNCLSAHQLPLAECMSRLAGRFTYVDAMERGQTFQSAATPEGMDVRRGYDDLIESCPALYTGMRDFGLFERRERRGLTTFYTSERWFKPPIGRLRLLHPKYALMQRRFRDLISNGRGFRYLPIGTHAAEDMTAAMGDKAPIEFEPRPLGAIARHPKFGMWGYFVSPSEKCNMATNRHEPQFSILWAGRMLKLKHVETIIKAAAPLSVSLTIAGDGPDAKRIRTIAARQ